MTDTDRPSDRSVQATRLQMELARLLGVPFAADRETQERSYAEHLGSLVPGLPEPSDGIVSLYLRLPLETLRALVEALREHGPLSTGGREQS